MIAPRVDDAKRTEQPDEAQRVQRILRQRARIVAHRREADVVAGESLQLVTFHVGQEWYGVDITRVQEVHPMGRYMWSRVPCAPEFIVGAINIRGRIYSVMDVAPFLGLPSRPVSETAHVLLVRTEGAQSGEEMEIGLLADDMPQVISVPQSKLQPSLLGANAQAEQYVLGVTPDMLVVLSLDRLLSDPAIVVHQEG